MQCALYCIEYKQLARTCDRLRLGAKWQKTDLESADLNGLWGFKSPSGHHCMERLLATRERGHKSACTSQRLFNSDLRFDPASKTHWCFAQSIFRLQAMASGEIGG
jgi:hypothetical protein